MRREENWSHLPRSGAGNSTVFRLPSISDAFASPTRQGHRQRLPASLHLSTVLIKMLLVVVSFFALLIYWSIPHRLRMAWLSLMSLGVVLSWDWLSGILVVMSSSLVYAGARQKKFNTAIMVLLVAQLVGVKVLWNTVPLGLSFFSFCLLHYCIETRRDNLPDHNASEFFAYTLLYPIYSAGPIERFDHFKNNLSDGPLWQQGITRIAIGNTLSR